ncbi:MAG: hypothetical protein ACXAB9_15110 [Candidatus Thorarchaeota archaeon]|jgi:rRNA small subunit pseudouridine methyltransferase Nep1
MTLLESPLCKAGQLSIHLHIQDGRVIKVNPDVRLPRNYDRFVGLIEQLLLRGRVPPEGEPLLQVIELDLSDLLTVLTKSTNESLSIKRPHKTSGLYSRMKCLSQWSLE